MFVYTAGTPPPHIQHYIDWLLSDKGQQVLKGQRLRSAPPAVIERSNPAPRALGNTRAADMTVVSTEGLRDRAPPGGPRAAAGRARERGIELLIRLCGISAIAFVFGIFFFVFREGRALPPAPRPRGSSSSTRTGIPRAIRRATARAR
jgi:hypothetical protein